MAQRPRGTVPRPMSACICYCGAQAGYPHDAACPRPLYRASDADAERWQAEYEQRRRILASITRRQLAREANR